MTPILETRPSPKQAVELVARGLPWRDAERLAAALNVPLATVASLLDIPTATFFRRRRARRFTRQESDRLMRFVRLWWLASDVFGDEEGARSWLKSPQFGLGGLVPLEYALTEAGAREVEDLMRRIDYGLVP
jgi:putative toxin-antitoxin system antitoxin component (TIGR02293 family)